MRGPLGVSQTSSSPMHGAGVGPGVCPAMNNGSRNGKRRSRRVVITGIGVVSCCGVGVQEFWSNVRDGHSGISKIDAFDVSDLSSKVGGQVRDFDPTDYLSAKDSERLGRFTQLAIASARLAVADAGLELDREDRYRCGVAFGSSGAGNGNIADEYYGRYFSGGLGAVHPTAIVEVPAHAAASHVAIDLGLKGPSVSASVGCVTAVATLSQAALTVSSGEADVVVAGGTEACLSRFIFGLLCRQRVLTSKNGDPSRACKPFDAQRDGLVLGEAAGAFILESAEHAENRGARVYGEVLGVGMTATAHHMVMSTTDGSELAEAMRRAMGSGGISPADIDYICAHGVGSPQLDLVETRAIKQALGARSTCIPVSSIKAVSSQPFAAAGALQVAATCMAMAENVVPPTTNLALRDAECDLDYVPAQARTARIDTALLNAYSFGGTYASAAIRRYDSLL